MSIFIDGAKIHYVGVGDIAACGVFWINVSNQKEDVTCDDCLKAIKKSEDFLHDAGHLLRDLLAVIHRDGGHYVSEHGLNKATKDAIDLILKERHEAEEIKWMYEDSSR